MFTAYETTLSLQTGLTNSSNNCGTSTETKTYDSKTSTTKTPENAMNLTAAGISVAAIVAMSLC
jgi:hypothetical protein